MKEFGYIKGMPYPDANDAFEKYQQFENTIPKKKVIAHIETLEEWLTSLPSKDIFTGKKLQAGLYQDGEFIFPLEFLHYYRNYDIGIPYDYEEYLREILAKEL